MKVRGAIVLVGLVLLVSCGSPAGDSQSDAEPEAAAEPVVEQTPDEAVAEMELMCAEATPAIAFES